MLKSQNSSDVAGDRRTQPIHTKHVVLTLKALRPCYHLANIGGKCISEKSLLDVGFKEAMK